MSHDNLLPGVRIQLRRDTEANWAIDNPVLRVGETGWTTDTLLVKLGDGVTAWNDLPYAIDSGQPGEVNTVAGVSPVANDIPEAALKTALDLPTDTNAELANRATDAELAAEATTRQNADNALDARLDVVETYEATFGDIVTHNASEFTTDAELAAEATTRANADTALDGRVDVLESVVTLNPISGETVAAATTRVNAALSSVNPAGTRRVVKLVGDFTFNAPLVIKSNTFFDSTAATLTLQTGSACNGIINEAVNTTRRVVDAVTTAASTTVTSATAAFVVGDVGKTIRIWNPSGTDGYHETTIQSRTNATTVVLTVAPSFTGTAQYASIGGRDEDIVVRAGKLIREAAQGNVKATAYLKHHVRFRHVDNIDVDVLDVRTLDGKYAVNFGDCTDVRVRRIYASYISSDALHINGPCARVTIDEVAADTTNDDIVSLTGADFINPLLDNVSDTYGDITDVHVDRIMCRGLLFTPTVAPRGMLILAGKNANGTIQFACKRISLNRFDGATKSYPVWIGGDTQDTTTLGGTYADINICGNGGTNKYSTPPGSFVVVRSDAVSVTRLMIGAVFNDGGTYDVEIAAPVTDLTLSGVKRSRLLRTSTGSLLGDLRILGEPDYGEVNGTVGITTIDRKIAGVQSVTLVSGIIYLSYFRVKKSQLATSAVTITRSPAAGGTTFAKYGIYEVNVPTTDSVTLVASTGNDVSIWNSTFAGHGRNFTTPITLDPTKTYAFACMFIGTTAPGVIGIQGQGGDMAFPDRLAMCRTAQTDLPATMDWSVLQSSEGKMIYARIVP